MSFRPEEWAVVSLGSNEGQSKELLRQAVEDLRRFSSKPVLSSSLWKTEPVGCPPGSRFFLNSVVLIAPKPGITPESLLAELHEMERDFGRSRTGMPNQPRPLDLDLILFREEVRSNQTLILPHPRWFTRRFVLEPLCELMPDYKAPGQDRTVRELRDALTDPFEVLRLE